MKKTTLLMIAMLLYFKGFNQSLYIPGSTSGISNNVTGNYLEYRSSGFWDGTIRANGTGYTSFALYQDDALRWAFYNHPGNTNTLLLANSAGHDKISITQAGYLGIGTVVPQKALHISGTGDVEQWIEATDNGFASLSLKSNNKKWHWSKRPGTEQDALRLFYHDGSAWSTPYMSVLPNGNIGIGSSYPTSKLSVKGKIHTEEVLVDMTVPGPDYVFEEHYNLLSLAELEAYIKVNKHLPEVPSAKEMEANGLHLKEMNLLLLKKVEELTLHLIEQKKVNDDQQKMIGTLMDKVSDLGKK